jgi:nitric oxide dioxygenase
MNTHSMRVISARKDRIDHDTYAFADLMTSEDRRLLLDSWHRLEPHADRLATVFFDRLNELTPAKRRLFAGSTLESQFVQFAYMLVEMVVFHDDPHTRLLATEQIRQCLSRYAIAHVHYEAVSEAITAVLTHAPEACATPESRDAWYEAYDLLTAIVRRASSQRWTAEWLARAS